MLQKTWPVTEYDLLFSASEGSSTRRTSKEPATSFREVSDPSSTGCEWWALLALIIVTVFRLASLPEEVKEKLEDPDSR